MTDQSQYMSVHILHTFQNMTHDHIAGGGISKPIGQRIEGVAEVVEGSVGHASGLAHLRKLLPDGILVGRSENRSSGVSVNVFNYPRVSLSSEKHKTNVLNSAFSDSALPVLIFTVLDCFGGSGTTALEANLLGRNAILCELNPAYIDILEARKAETAPLLMDV